MCAIKNEYRPKTIENIHSFTNLPTKSRGALTLATTWMDPENTMLRERSQTQKDTQCVIPLMGNVQNRQIHRNEWIRGCQGLGEGERQ